MQRSVPIAVALALASASAAAPVQAQYQWRDENGRMTFSDLPPPASTPPARVLRAPARPAPQAPTAPSAAAPLPQTGAALRDAGGPGASQPASAADRELEFRKRQLERSDAERKQAERRAQAERNARACEDARGSMRVLESGMRITQVNGNGEREYLSDEARERKLAAMRQDIEQQCEGR